MISFSSLGAPFGNEHSKKKKFPYFKYLPSSCHLSVTLKMMKLPRQKKNITKFSCPNENCFSSFKVLGKCCLSLSILVEGNLINENVFFKSKFVLFFHLYNSIYLKEAKKKNKLCWISIRNEEFFLCYICLRKQNVNELREI